MIVTRCCCCYCCCLQGSKGRWQDIRSHSVWFPVWGKREVTFHPKRRSHFIISPIVSPVFPPHPWKMTDDSHIGEEGKGWVLPTPSPPLLLFRKGPISRSWPQERWAFCCCCRYCCCFGTRAGATVEYSNLSISLRRPRVLSLNGSLSPRDAIRTVLRMLKECFCIWVYDFFFVLSWVVDREEVRRRETSRASSLGCFFFCFVLNNVFLCVCFVFF